MQGDVVPSWVARTLAMVARAPSNHGGIDQDCSPNRGMNTVFKHIESLTQNGSSASFLILIGG